eukprot:SAG11_NODE_159_length_14027_cov_6.893667_11_plen_117_part_00
MALQARLAGGEGEGGGGGGGGGDASAGGVYARGATVMAGEGGCTCYKVMFEDFESNQLHLAEASRAAVALSWTATHPDECGDLVRRVAIDFLTYHTAHHTTAALHVDERSVCHASD